MLDSCSQGKYWIFELYPDSMNPNSFDILKAIGGSYAHIMVSPLHEYDVKSDGSPKKPHYHVLICYGNKVYFKRFYNLVLELGGVIPPEPRVVDVDHMRVYFVHMTPKAISDGKYIYKPEDCRFYSDKWYLEEYKRLCENLQCTGIDKTETICDILDLCDYYDFKGIHPLLKYVRQTIPQFTYFIIQNQSTIKSLLASQVLFNYDPDTKTRITEKPKDPPVLVSKVKKIIKK